MELPIFSLELALVPGEPMPLHIFEQRYQDMVAWCEENDEPFVIVYSDEDGMRDIGCTAEITQILEQFPDGRSNIITLGGIVVRIESIHDEHSYRSADVEPVTDAPADAPLDAQEAAIAIYSRLAGELEVVTGLLAEIHRGMVLTRETQERARRNGRVRTPEELARELGLDD